MFLNLKKSEKKEAEKRRNIAKLSEEISKIWSGESSDTTFDVNGSYTGNPADNGVPVQDADDL